MLHFVTSILPVSCGSKTLFLKSSLIQFSLFLSWSLLQSSILSQHTLFFILSFTFKYLVFKASSSLSFIFVPLSLSLSLSSLFSLIRIPFHLLQSLTPLFQTLPPLLSRSFALFSLLYFIYFSLLVSSLHFTSLLFTSSFWFVLHLPDFWVLESAYSKSDPFRPLMWAKVEALLIVARLAVYKESKNKNIEILH